MRKLLVIILICFIICLGTYRWGDVRLEHAKYTVIEQVYVGISELFMPHIHVYKSTGDDLLYRDVEQMVMPIVSAYRITSGYQKLGQEDSWIEEIKDTSDIIKEAEYELNYNTSVESENLIEYVGNASSTAIIEDSEHNQKQQIINRTKLQDFDYLRQLFYQVDNTTTIDSSMLDVNKLLMKDMTIKKNVNGPQILIYHTHSQENYADSLAGDASTSVVALGDYLARILSEKYGVEVLHHTGQYDVINRDGAYAEALPNLEKIIKDNPTIEVAIDIHRDGVPITTHLVTDIQGKQTAQIMFFNGLSRTTAMGELEYLANPYIEDNLAFSFQMQLTAAEYYPDFTRRIYLKGYRYNMHLLPKSLLVEVGAQTNTFQEAKNAMEPLADVLIKVLNGL